jgi:hypothetical protein
LNRAAARVLTDNASPIVEQVQHRRRQRYDEATRERMTNYRLSRMRVYDDEDGMILLPGIMNTHSGRTILMGPPRSAFPNPQRLGVPHGPYTGRLTGGAPRMGGPRHGR